jgi:hypothetical protein
LKNKKVTVEGEDFFAPAVIICTGAEAQVCQTPMRERGVVTCLESSPCTFTAIVGNYSG